MTRFCSPRLFCLLGLSLCCFITVNIHDLHFQYKCMHRLQVHAARNPWFCMTFWMWGNIMISTYNNSIWAYIHGNFILSNHYSGILHEWEKNLHIGVQIHSLFPYLLVSTGVLRSTAEWQVGRFLLPRLVNNIPTTTVYIRVCAVNVECTKANFGHIKAFMTLASAVLSSSLISTHHVLDSLLSISAAHFIAFLLITGWCQSLPSWELPIIFRLPNGHVRKNKPILLELF